ncbi:FadR/GntR family transcriptional regulator [Asticcacaulis benevestitus]|nr:FCD domain-containing protein [Asticcacaulis benevestitus]
METHLNLNMAARLLEAIGPAIIRGDYDQRPFPNEAESTDVFGVSRTVVREAVKSLMAKGLLDSRPRVGTQVQPVAKWNLLDADVMRWIVDSPNSDVFLREYADLRRGLEPMAAGLAAKLGSPSALSQIESAFADLKLAQSQDEKVSAIRRLHDGVIEGSGNLFYVRLQATMSVVFNRFAKDVLPTVVVNLDQYAAVINAIRARDINRAETAMRWLLDDESRSLEARRDSNPLADVRSVNG